MSVQPCDIQDFQENGVHFMYAHVCIGNNPPRLAPYSTVVCSRCMDGVDVLVERDKDFTILADWIKEKTRCPKTPSAQ